MIHLVSCAWSREPIDRLRASLGRDLDGLVAYISYEDLFVTERGPIGHYVFTDLDRLSRYERDAAAAFARALARAEPAARILNPPDRTIADRTSLLHALYARGINTFTATRLDTDDRPARYPVFIRPADGHDGAESDLLADATAFDRAIADLRALGVPLAGRIAVGFAAQRFPDGLYRKYGVFNIGGRLVPQHVMRSTDWSVKNSRSLLSDAAAEEELAFVRQNPHAGPIAEVFAVAGIDFGRADYGLVDGRPQIYEINTNPHFPRFEKGDARSQRRLEIREQLLAALRAIGETPTARGQVGFELPTPRAHPVRLPVSWPGVRLAPRLARAFLSRVMTRMTRRQSTPEAA